MTLTEFLKGIADAIRNKKGTTEKIKAIDFATEITNLPSGGGPISQEEYDTAVNTATNILSGALGYDWNGKQTKTSYMFDGFKGTSIDVTGLNTKDVIDMQYMFRLCSNLEELDLSGFNTENVTNMQYMFRQCGKLIDLDLSSFRTENLTNTQSMFYQCTALEKINLKNFNPINITSFTNMFGGTSEGYRVPFDCEIITNQTMANWINEKFPSYTNITIVKADWEV